MSWSVYESPLGPLTLIGGPAGLAGVRFPGKGPALREADHDPDALADAAHQLEEYFTGRRRSFELRLDLRGTPFQRAVWDQLQALPYGTTVSYGELARRIERPDRVRAVGGAVGRTPVPIIVPCHRVIGSDGSLTGYGGGIHRKAALLSLESSVAAGGGPEPAWHFRQLAMSL
jgi:methylated-DNA-[protein]-cysteine S-methyltransferase